MRDHVYMTGEMVKYLFVRDHVYDLRNSQIFIHERLCVYN